MLKFTLNMLNRHLSFPYRHDKLTRIITPLLTDSKTVLDVGTGDGQLASRLIETSGCDLTGVDVYMQPQTYIEVQPYDGEVLPFPDKSFDTVMMVDMLHHAHNPEQLIVEAKRVARNYVLVKDHFWKNRFDQISLCVADYLGNIPYNVSLPYNFLSLDEWDGLFRRHNLAQVSHSAFKYHRLEPAYHIMAKLAVTPAVTPDEVLDVHLLTPNDTEPAAVHQNGSRIIH